MLVERVPVIEREALVAPEEVKLCTKLLAMGTSATAEELDATEELEATELEEATDELEATELEEDTEELEDTELEEATEELEATELEEAAEELEDWPASTGPRSGVPT